MVGYGSQYTHGGYIGWLAPGGPVLSGLQRLEMRKDGFGSLSSPNSTVVIALLLVRLADANRADLQAVLFSPSVQRLTCKRVVAAFLHLRLQQLGRYQFECLLAVRDNTTTRCICV